MNERNPRTLFLDKAGLEEAADGTLINFSVVYVSILAPLVEHSLKGLKMVACAQINNESTCFSCQHRKKSLQRADKKKKENAA